MSAIDVYILAGQSNASGARTGRATHLADHPSDLDKDILYQWRSPAPPISARLEWGPLQPIPDFDPDQGFRFAYFGPEIMLARSLAATARRSRRNRKVAIFKYASPGRAIAYWWNDEGAQKYYTQMLDDIKSAVSQLEDKGHNVRVAGLFWIQGESDAVKEEESSKYKARLTSIITNLRSDLGVPRLRIVLGLFERFRADYISRVIEAQWAIADDDPYIYRSSMWRLKESNVSGHLEPESILRHGRRIYLAYMRYTRPQ